LYVIPSHRALIRNTFLIFRSFLRSRKIRTCTDFHPHSHKRANYAVFPDAGRLLILGKTEIENPESNPPIFSSVNTPNLTSLALGETDLDYQSFEHAFSRIFTQVSTFAIQDFLESDLETARLSIISTNFATSVISRSLQSGASSKLAETQRLAPRFTASIAEAASKGRGTSRIAHVHHRRKDSRDSD